MLIRFGITSSPRSTLFSTSTMHCIINSVGEIRYLMIVVQYRISAREGSFSDHLQTNSTNSENIMIAVMIHSVNTAGSLFFLLVTISTTNPHTNKSEV